MDPAGRPIRRPSALSTRHPGSWWRQASDWGVPLFALALLYVGLGLDFLLLEANGQPNVLAVLLEIFGLLVLEAMAIIGAPRLAAELFAAEHRHRTFEMLVLTPFPRKRLVLGALAGGLRTYALALAAALPGVILIGLRWPEGASTAGACILDTHVDFGLFGALIGWMEAVGYFLLGSVCGAYVSLRWGSGFVASNVSQLVILAAFGVSRLSILVLMAVGSRGPAKTLLVGPFLLLAVLAGILSLTKFLFDRLENVLEVD